MHGAVRSRTAAECGADAMEVAQERHRERALARAATAVAEQVRTTAGPAPVRATTSASKAATSALVGVTI